MIMQEMSRKTRVITDKMNNIELSSPYGISRLRESKNKSLYLDRISINEEHRGTRTYGPLMLKLIETIAKRKGFKSIFLHCGKNLINFYIRNGYKIIDSEADYFELEKIL